jgi:hypothetical protein
VDCGGAGGSAGEGRLQVSSVVVVVVGVVIMVVAIDGGGGGRCLPGGAMGVGIKSCGIFVVPSTRTCRWIRSLRVQLEVVFSASLSNGYTTRAISRVLSSDPTLHRIRSACI